MTRERLIELLNEIEEGCPCCSDAIKDEILDTFEEMKNALKDLQEGIT